MGSCLGHCLILLLVTLIFGPVGGLLYITLLVFMGWLAFR